MQAPSKRPGKRGHIVAHDVSWAAQTGKHLLRTQNVSEQNQKHFLCPGHKICVRNKCCARGQTEKHLCRQQCVGKNVSSFAMALMAPASRLFFPVPVDYCVYKFLRSSVKGKHLMRFQSETSHFFKFLKCETGLILRPWQTRTHCCGHIVADTLLRTQMFPRLPARATFVADTNFVSRTQKCF